MESLESRRLLSAGDLDASFGGDGTVETDIVGHADAMAAQVSVATPDGKLLVAGQVRHGGGNNFALARYNPDGTLDRSFGDDGRVVTDVNGGSFDEIADADVSPDGRILVAGTTGRSPWYTEGSDIVVARYNADGSLDSTFGGDGVVLAGEARGVAAAVSAAPGGKVVVVGTTGYSGSGDVAVLRYNADGTPDESFGEAGRVTTNVDPGDPVDDTSPSDDVASDAYVFPDGRILVGGRSWGEFLLIRYRPDGSIDPTFGPGGDAGDGIVTTAFGGASLQMQDLTVWRNRIVVAGTASYGYEYARADFAVARFDLGSGALDRTFSGDGRLTVDFAGGRDEAAAVLVRGDGGVVVAGYATLPATLEDFAMARFDLRGRPVASFGTAGKVTTDFATPGGPTYDRAADATFTRDGRIVLAGPAAGLPGGDFGTSGAEFGLARYSAGGALDRTFGPGGDAGDGKVTTPFRGSVANYGNDAVVQRDGKTVVAGTALLTGGLTDVVLTRYTRSGALDPTFGGGDGVATLDLTPTRDGRSSDFVSGVALDRYGRILVVGATDVRSPGPIENSGGARRWDLFVARFRPDGSLDRPFGGGAGYVVTNLGSDEDFASSIAVAPDGRIVVAGQTRPAGAQWSRIATLRYLPTGALDATFGGDGVVLTDLPGATGEHAGAVVVQQDGRVVVAGTAWEENTGQNFALLRFAGDGSLDPTFGGGDGWLTTDFGGSDAARAVTIGRDGKIVAAGEGQSSHGRRFSDFAAARYLSDGTPDPTFGAGGRALLARDAADDTWDVANDVHVQRDGKVVLIGTTVHFPIVSPNGGDPGRADFAAVRFGADGILDAGFGAGGIAVVSFGPAASAVAGGGGIDPFGRLVLAGGVTGFGNTLRPTNSDFAVARLLL